MERMKGSKQRNNLWYFLFAGSALVFLAFVAVPNFIGGPDPVAMRVSRVRMDLRNLAVNLETYYIEHKTYPPPVDSKRGPVPFGDNGGRISAGFVPWLLTTPIAYTSLIPPDAFVQNGYYPENYPANTYRYATNGETFWILAGVGPDRDVDIDLSSPQTKEIVTGSQKDIFDGLRSLVYDSTNGTRSSGDIIRIGPQ
jgi:hypothetical protein